MKNLLAIIFDVLITALFFAVFYTVGLLTYRETIHPFFLAIKGLFL